MKKLLFLLISSLAVSSFGQTILSENFGSPSATTLIPAYSTGTAPATFQSVAPITFSGTGDVRSSAPSSTYTGYSAGGNCFLTNTAGKYLQINGLNTSAYTPATINFTFGYWSYNAPTTQLILQYSIDGGTNWTNINFLNNTTAGWNLVTVPNGTLPASSTLSIKFSQPGTTDQFRIDDIKIFNVNPNCLFSLGTPTTACNTTTYNIDTYSATIPFTGGTGGTFTISSTTGTVAGDNPSTVANGNIIVNGITEGTSITIHAVGVNCDWTLPIPSKDCKPINTLPFYEPFSYAGGYALGTSQMWGYISSGNDIVAYSPGLAYTGLNVTGNAVKLSGSGNDAMVPFTDQTSGTVYVSFLMQVTSTTGVTTFPALTYYASFTKSTPSYQARLFLNTTSATQYQIGLDANAAVTTNLDTTSRTVGDVLLVIMGYDFSTQTLKAWINPSNLATFATTTPTLTSIATTAISDIGGFVLRQDSGLTTPTTIIDEVKIFNNPAFLLSNAQFNEIAGFKVYPNPVTDGKLFVETAINGNKEITVYDTLGKQVLSTITNTNEVNVANLLSGMYFVKVSEDNKTSYSKFIVK
ncbi:MAG: T9SS type A sorting domain-containing protein [Flavobacterium sp.]